MFDFFGRIIAYFDLYNIPYMLSGSIAMGLYHLPRSTRDLDFVVHLGPDDIEGFLAWFEGPYYCSPDAVKDAVNRRSLFNVIDHASGYKADFVILKSEEYRLVEFERRKLVDYYGVSFYTVSLEDLLISKLIWIQTYQSSIQANDITNLAALPQLDRQYLNYWIKQLNLTTFDLLP
jgi:hypothetical protein